MSVLRNCRGTNLQKFIVNCLLWQAVTSNMEDAFSLPFHKSPNDNVSVDKQSAFQFSSSHYVSFCLSKEIHTAYEIYKSVFFEENQLPLSLKLKF